MFILYFTLGLTVCFTKMQTKANIIIYFNFFAFEMYILTAFLNFVAL